MEKSRHLNSHLFILKLNASCSYQNGKAPRFFSSASFQASFSRCICSIEIGIQCVHTHHNQSTNRITTEIGKSKFEFDSKEEANIKKSVNILRKVHSYKGIWPMTFPLFSSLFLSFFLSSLFPQNFNMKIAIFFSALFWLCAFSF